MFETKVYIKCILPISFIISCLFNVFLQNRKGKDQIQTHHEHAQTQVRGGAHIDCGTLFQSLSYEIRGSHSAQFTTELIRRGQIKCKKDTHIIPLTLFFDRDAKTFLEKEMEINGFLMNDLDEVEAELGRAIVNVSEYVNIGDKVNDKFLLQVQLSDQKDRQTTMKFHMSIEKQDDDSKSVQSSETNQNSKRVSDNGEKQEIKNNFKVHKVKESESSSNFQGYSKETSPEKQDRKNTPSKEKKKIDSLQVSNDIQNKHLVKQKQTIHYDQQQDFFNLGTPDVSRRPPNHDDDETKTVDMNSSKKIATSARPPLPDKKSKEKDKIQENQSHELKIFLNEKSLRQKDKELQAAKREILNQKKVIEQLMQEQSRQLQSIQVKKYLREIQSLKSQLLHANIKISELQTSTRHYQQHEEQNSKLIEKQAKKISYYKQLLEKEKLRVARIMQKGLQSGDNDLICFIEEALGEDNYND